MVYSIDEMPHLSARLGRARCDRIRYLDRSNPWRQSGATNLINDCLLLMQGRTPGDPGCPVADVIAGIARLDHQQTRGRSIPLSSTRLYAILQCMSLINTREVMAMLDVDTRQAQKYVRACRMILKQLSGMDATSLPEVAPALPVAS